MAQSPSHLAGTVCVAAGLAVAIEQPRRWHSWQPEQEFEFPHHESVAIGLVLLGAILMQGKDNE